MPLLQFAVRFDATGPSSQTVYTFIDGHKEFYKQHLGGRSYNPTRSCCSRQRSHKHRVELLVAASGRDEAIALGSRAVAEAFPGTPKFIEVVTRKTREYGPHDSKRQGVFDMTEISR